VKRVGLKRWAWWCPATRESSWTAAWTTSASPVRFKNSLLCEGRVSKCFPLGLGISAGWRLLVPCSHPWRRGTRAAGLRLSRCRSWKLWLEAGERLSPELCRWPPTRLGAQQSSLPCVTPATGCGEDGAGLGPGNLVIPSRQLFAESRKLRVFGFPVSLLVLFQPWRGYPLGGWVLGAAWIC